MATAEPEQMKLARSEGNLFEQDRKKFRPIHAIRKMFRERKKSKQLSRSLGSISSLNLDERGSSSLYVRNMSHDSVFVSGGAAALAPSGTAFRHALSVGDVTEVTVPINRLKGSDNMVMESTSSGSNENHRNCDVTRKASSADVEVDLDMNDIAVNVPRLDNKAAYDKIALRPKRRPARNARGTQQQHVVRVQSQVNGFTEVNPFLLDEEQTDKAASRDASPPKAKKPRTPILFASPQEALGEASSPTPKRYSMLGRSPMGPGPGMIAPTLHEVQNFKLRKAQGNKSNAPAEKTPEKSKGGKSKVVPDKAAKTKAPKKPARNKKSSKQDQKSSSEGTSSIFPWKNKPSTFKTPVPSPKGPDRSNESEKSKGFFPGLRPSKKSVQENESKVSSKSVSNSEKKETSKKSGFKLGRREKNSAKTTPVNTMDVVEDKITTQLPILPTAEKSDKPLNSPKVEIVREPPNSPDLETSSDFFPESFKTGIDEESAEKSLLEQISEELSQKQDSQSVVQKRDNGSSKYTAKLKLEAKRLADNRVEQPRSSEPVNDKEMLHSENRKTAANAAAFDDAAEIAVSSDSVTEDKSKSSLSPSSAKSRPFSFRKAKDFKINDLKLLSPSPEQALHTSPKLASPSADDQPNRSTGITEALDQEKSKRLSSSPDSAVANTQLSLIRNPDKSLPKVTETPRTQSLNQKEEEKSQASDIANAASENSLSAEISASPSSVAEQKTAVQHLSEEMRTKDVQVTSDKTNVQPIAQTKREKPGSLGNNETVATKNRDRKDRDSSSDAKAAGGESPVEIYSKTKLKSVGGQRVNGRTASVKISPGNTPTKPLRPHSFSVKSPSPKSAETSASPSTKPQTLTEKTLQEASRTKPSRTEKEKSSAAVMSESPVKHSSRATSNEISLQDAVNNNVKLSESAKQPEKKSPPLERRTREEQKGGDEVPAWVQMARRRSKVWEEDPYKPQRTTSQRSRAATDSAKDDSRPKTLTIAPTEKTAKPESDPVKTTPTTTSEKVQINRTASIPAIGVASARKSSPAAKEAPELAETGKPSWLAIAMQKQKNWAKEETV